MPVPGSVFRFQFLIYELDLPIRLANWACVTFVFVLAVLAVVQGCAYCFGFLVLSLPIVGFFYRFRYYNQAINHLLIHVYWVLSLHIQPIDIRFVFPTRLANCARVTFAFVLHTVEFVLHQTLLLLG